MQDSKVRENVNCMQEYSQKHCHVTLVCKGTKKYERNEVSPEHGGRVTARKNARKGSGNQ